MKFYGREKELKWLGQTRKVAFENHSQIYGAWSIYFPEITSFAGLFETLMEIGRNLAYNLVIDEFQEFFYINPAVYSQIHRIIYGQWVHGHEVHGRLDDETKLDVPKRRSCPADSRIRQKIRQLFRHSVSHCRRRQYFAKTFQTYGRHLHKWSSEKTGIRAVRRNHQGRLSDLFRAYSRKIFHQETD